MGLQITRGVKKRAQRIVLYGVEGIGKSTFASQFPDPLFIDTEGSTDHMDVMRLQTPTSWIMLLQTIKEFCNNPQGFKTLVIDTIDWAEELAIRYLCEKNRWSSIETPGYGRGYVELGEEIGLFLNLMDEVIKNGTNVLFTAHARIRKFEQPDELGAYDKYELKLGKNSVTKVKEWADMLLFANYKNSIVTTNGGKTKAANGRRLMYTTHAPQWDAKNRHGLAPELPFDFKEIAHVIPGDIVPEDMREAVGGAVTMKEAAEFVEKQTQEPKTESTVIDFEEEIAVPPALKDLMIKDGISVEQIQAVVAARGKYPQGTPIKNYEPGFIEGWIIVNWPHLVSFIKQNNL